MVDTISAERRSSNMSRIRSRNTKPEVLMRSLLHRAGFRFRLHDRSLPGTPDIVLKKYHAVVLVHGCFWHRHTGCRFTTTPSTRTEFWAEKFKRTVKHDKYVHADLTKQGWRVITVWECELIENPASVIGKVRLQLLGGDDGKK
jgi:DNA mismatch endonuclease, patch repair protein